MTLATTTTTTADENVKKKVTLHVHHAFLYITFCLFVHYCTTTTWKCPRVLRSSVLRASDRCREGHRFNSSHFFFVPCSWHVNHITYHRVFITIMGVWACSFWQKMKIGSFGTDDGYGSKNVTFKMYSRFSNFVACYIPIRWKCQM